MKKMILGMFVAANCAALSAHAILPSYTTAMMTNSIGGHDREIVEAQQDIQIFKSTGSTTLQLKELLASIRNENPLLKNASDKKIILITDILSTQE